RHFHVTGVQTCALPLSDAGSLWFYDRCQYRHQWWPLHGLKEKGTMRIIKKYPNRRLYDTEKSSYSTQASVYQLIREDVDFKVVRSEERRVGKARDSGGA